MTYYKTINGIRYDRELLALTDQLSQSNPIDIAAIQHIWAEVSDGGRITPTEKLTLNYIQQIYTLSPEAINWISHQLNPTLAWEDKVNKHLIEHLDLPDLQWDIDEHQMMHQLKKNAPLTLETVLTGVVHAIYNNSLGYFALWHVSRNQREQRHWINKGRLSLLDPKKDQDRLTPAFWKNEEEWLHFILEVPDFSPIQLVIYIRLSSPSAYGFCKSMIKRELALASSLDQIIKERLQCRQLTIGQHWEWAEEEEQSMTDFGLGWRDALYLALSDGIHNQESDITLQTAFLWEEWFELEGFEGIRAASKRFLKSASIHFIPKHYKVLAEENAILRQIPEEAKLNFDNYWYFLFFSADYPDRQVIAYCRKDGDGIEDSWHDLYLIEDKNQLGDQISEVTKVEFGLIDLDIQINPQEFEQQKKSYRAGWRPTKTIFRQLLNCILKDHASSDSYLQMMNGSKADLSAAPSAFSPAAKAKFYLNKSTIRLKSIANSDMAKIENYWIFQLQTPALPGRVFEVFVPRFPDFEEESGVPYNQMI